MDSQKLQEIQKDPHKALDFAKAYQKEGKYEQALEMHEWYHFNVLSIQSSQYGVRLSFALSDWMKLAEIYPKAKQRLIEIRNEEVEKIKNGNWKFENFHDVEAISRRLGNDEIPIDLFKLICKTETDKNKVKKCFDSIFEVSVNKKEIGLLHEYMDAPLVLVSKYINSFKDNESVGKEYINKMEKSNIKENVIQRVLDGSKKGYINNMSVLFNALKLLDKSKDIEEVYKAGKGVVPDEEYQKIFELK